jgi:enamine deaminase RidA (YjgF/YER057c/UK114 family)
MMRALLLTNDLARPIAEYSHAASNGSLVFVGAKGATQAHAPPPFGGDLARSLEHQTPILYRNIESVLDRFGVSAAEVLHVTSFITDWRFDAAVATGLERYFAVPRPATTWLLSPSFAVPELLYELDLVVSLTARTEVHAVEGRTIASYGGGFLFSGTISAAADCVTCDEELTSIGAQIDELLSQYELKRDNLLRMRLSLRDARDLDAVESWLDGWRNAHPPVVAAVTGSRQVGRRIAADVIAARELPERVSARAAGWGDGDRRTVAAAACGVLFTAATAGRGVGRELGVGGIAERAAAAAEALGATLDDTLKVEGTIEDWRLYPRFGAEYAAVFSYPYPARSLTQGGSGFRGSSVQLGFVISVDGGASMLSAPRIAGAAGSGEHAGS